MFRMFRKCLFFVVVVVVFGIHNQGNQIDDVRGGYALTMSVIHHETTSDNGYDDWSYKLRGQVNQQLNQGNPIDGVQNNDALTVSVVQYGQHKEIPDEQKATDVLQYTNSFQYGVITPIVKREDILTEVDIPLLQQDIMWGRNLHISNRSYTSRDQIRPQPIIEEALIERLWVENNEEVMVLSEIAVEQGVEAIDQYFTKHNTPLAGYGKVFIRVSQEMRLDWRLLPAIAFKESTGGKFLFRPYNPFGWGRKSFASFSEAIETVGFNLAGKNPRTAGFYEGKTIYGKLASYNSEKEGYTEIIFWIMHDIEYAIQNSEGP